MDTTTKQTAVTMATTRHSNDVAEGLDPAEAKRLIRLAHELDNWKYFGTIGFDAYVEWVQQAA